MNEQPSGNERSSRWDSSYEDGGDRVSWSQDEAGVSKELIDDLGLAQDAPVIDVGGGASPLTGQLVADGFTDLTVLDVSGVALDKARKAMPDGADRVTWVKADLLEWNPTGSYLLWHDRAVLHFLNSREDQEAYADLVRSVVRPGGHAVIGTFSLEGPERCSGLPVTRYGRDELTELLGDVFEVVGDRSESHITPGGKTQEFTWIVARHM